MQQSRSTSLANLRKPKIEQLRYVYFDGAQAEARIVGWEGRIASWMHQFEQARLNPGTYDAHCALASEMFGIPYDKVPKVDFDDVTKQRTIRYTAKRCLPADAEVLTPNGWEAIKDVAGSDTPIMSWNNDVLAFDTPSDWYISQTSNEPLVRFRGEFCDLAVTSDHRMPVYNNGKLNERPAQEFLSKRYGSMPLSGVYNAGTLDYKHARLYAACWADGHLEAAYPNSIRITVKKQRKADRLRMLLAKTPFRVWENTSSDGMQHFRIYGFRDKRLTWDMIHWQPSCREEFLDELKYWDGHIDTGRVFNTNHNDMSIIQTLCHLSGRRGVIFNHGVPKPNEAQCYLIRPTNSTRVYYSSMEVTTEPYIGKVYCPTVRSGAFLVRYNGHICITFNCRHGLNYRMQAAKLAEALKCPIAEAERLWNIYHRTTPELRRWWQTVIEEVRKTRQLWTCLGRRIEFLGDRLDDQMLDAIIAFKPQSTIGDLVCTAQQRSQDDDDWPMYARIPFNNHDSLTALCRERDVQRVARIMKKYAEAPLVIHGEQLIIPAEFKVSVPDKEGVMRWYQWGKLEVAA